MSRSKVLLWLLALFLQSLTLALPANAQDWCGSKPAPAKWMVCKHGTVGNEVCHCEDGCSSCETIVCSCGLTEETHGVLLEAARHRLFANLVQNQFPQPYLTEVTLPACESANVCSGIEQGLMRPPRA